MFRNDIKELSSFDLIEDIKLISQELSNRFDNDEFSKDLTDLIKTLSNKLLTKVN